MLDSLAAAKHETGHAIVQSLLGIGPEDVRVWQSEDGGWGGQSRLFQKAAGDENCARRLVSQLAGPIAQITCAPESLGVWRGLFSETVINPAIGVMTDRGGPLWQLLWKSDLLDCHLLSLASKAPSDRSSRDAYRMGGFLYEAESILIKAFRNTAIKNEVSSVASVVATKKFLSRFDFEKVASNALSSPLLEGISTFDFGFSPPITTRK